VYGVTVSFAFVPFAALLVRTASGFPASVKGYYVTSIWKVCTCFCARSPVKNCSSSGPGYSSAHFSIFRLFLRVVIFSGVE
jgi:hypothetical protein